MCDINVLQTKKSMVEVFCFILQTCIQQQCSEDLPRSRRTKELPSILTGPSEKAAESCASDDDSSGRRHAEVLQESMDDVISSIHAKRVKKSKGSSTYRNSLLSFIKLMKGLNLKDEHIKVLQDLPFWKIISLVREGKIVPLDVWKNSSFVDEIIRSFQKEKDIFIMKEKELIFEANDIAIIFGLPLEGEKVDTSKHVVKSTLEQRERTFIAKHYKKEKINKKSIEAALVKSLKGNNEEDCKDIARLITAYLLCTFFLSSSACVLQMVLVPRIFDFSKMKNVSWPATIEDHLMKQIRAYSNEPRKITACITALLFWFCEKLNPIEPKINYVASDPSAAKWALNNLKPDLIPTYIRADAGKSSIVDGLNEELLEKIQTLEAKDDLIQQLRAEIDELKKENKELRERCEKNSMSFQSLAPSQLPGPSQPHGPSQPQPLRSSTRLKPDVLVQTGINNRRAVSKYLARGRESIVVGAGFDITPQLKQKAQEKKPKQGPRSKKTPPQPDLRKEKAYFEEVNSFELVEKSPTKIARSCSRPIYKIMATPVVPSISSSNINFSALTEKKPERILDNIGMLDKSCIISSFDSLWIKDENESFDVFNALENDNIIKGIDGGIVKEESSDLQSASSTFAQLLMVKQATPVRLSEVFSTYCDPSNIRKIGEGTYGEAFRAGQTVCKVVPIDGDSLVNGEIQKRSEEVLEEVLLSLTLNNLREQKGEADVYNSCTNFIETKGFRICQGVYDSSLIHAWEEWDAIHGSENDHPKEFSAEQCYIVFVLADGGKDLESFVLSNYDEARSLIVQATAALAVAETACEFEHRDLHWGNILLSRRESCMLEFTLEGKKRSIKTFGLNISIIDFTLSRINTGEAILFLDLSQDPELFEGPKRNIQSETYRQMRKITGDCWEGSFPKTNVLWIAYLVGILLTKKSFTRTSKDENELRLFEKHLRSYDSAKECLSDSFFNGVLDVCEAETLSI